MNDSRSGLQDGEPAASHDKERAGIQSVEVGFALLDVLARAAGPLMLRDLAAAAEMSAAKAHRYLVSFQRLGLVMQDAGTTRYDLGPAALKLGLASLSRLDAVQMGRERLPALLETGGAHAGAGGLGQPWADHRALAGVAAGQPGEPAPGRCDAVADFGHGALLRRAPHARPHAGQDRTDDSGRVAAAAGHSARAVPRRPAHDPGAGGGAVRRRTPARHGAGGRYAATRRGRLLRAGVRFRRPHGAGRRGAGLGRHL